VLFSLSPAPSQVTVDIGTATAGLCLFDHMKTRGMLVAHMHRHVDLVVIAASQSQHSQPVAATDGQALANTGVSRLPGLRVVFMV
jgi:hypothetical protein